ncbi:hypothetical protein SAMN05216404_10181 [Nitrosospira multiformis]|uniref:Uncharacterized protein n=1 Tax=Nitrosospira multiformis TaxID=1231 RepID=A0A1H8AZC0_9PROT|nr:hypothetical protein SAMN05216404_10181 [Nitrosospira multiformis]
MTADGFRDQTAVIILPDQIYRSIKQCDDGLESSSVNLRSSGIYTTRARPGTQGDSRGRPHYCKVEFLYLIIMFKVSGKRKIGRVYATSNKPYSKNGSMNFFIFISPQESCGE